MAFEIFATEEAVIAAAQQRLDNNEFSNAEEQKAYGELLKAYKKLYKTTRKLIRLSDRNEAELNAMAAKQRQAGEEIARKNKELEVLSSKLAKYLPPQVYDMIFSGKQEVTIASQRKKLSVFFSDIADFTGTTDKLESEDLTQLLNQYLTEMARIAQQYGGTIDKYIGDAIMIFFGDPESRGVKQDALACVKMAIAMQKRMQELEGVWRDVGVERPLHCRIGISTGYCTVGNFGSEDRMDYTIIGGGVNLASRLETAAPPGGVLISYETHALVKDEVYCQELGSIQVKGIANPVATYRAIDLYDNLSDDSRVIHVDHPLVKLNIDLDHLSGEQQRETCALLQQALDRLADPNETSGKTSSDKTGENKDKKNTARPGVKRRAQPRKRKSKADSVRPGAS